MKNSNIVPHKSTESNRSPTNTNSNYPHAYLNANTTHSNNLMHQNFNYSQSNYMANYNPYYQYQNQYQSHPAQMMPPNFNYHQNPYFNPHQMQPSFHSNYQQSRQFNQNFNNHNPQHNRNPNNNNNNNNYKSFNNNNRNQQKNKNHNSQKTAPSPQQEEFYCESCDRGFKVEEKFKEHCLTHKTCNVNGCKFTAAAKLVEIHFKNFHASGLDKKVTSLETPEEIKKYINERKKNFPSNKNLEEKVKLNDEKSSRGAVLNTQQYGRLNKRKCDNIEKGDPKKFNRNETEQIQSTNENKYVNNNKNNRNKKKRNKKNVLLKKKNALKYELTKPTLLQKLLADEIRHERNIILQCVRYVVENNFFEKSSKIDSCSENVFEPVETDEVKSSEIIVKF